MALVELSAGTKSFLSRSHGILIGKDWVNADGGEPINVVNPADGQAISAIGESSKANVDMAVAAARDAFENGPWSTMKPGERSGIMHKIAALMEENAEEIAQLETLDNGKPIKFARGEVFASASAIRYYAGWADKINGSTHNVNMPGDFHVYTLKEPVGVVALIVPWNYPLVMAAMKLGPALAAGCTCVLKPAEDTSLTALRMGEIMLEAGLPEGVVNIVTGLGRTTGAALASHDGVNKIAFTGSTVTGKAIAQIAAADLKKVSLELGGKSPNIIMDDANLEAAIPASAMGIFFNSGQTCTAPSRMYVHEKIADQVIEGVAAVGRGMTIAPGLDEDSDLGPLVSQKQFDRVSGYIEAGREEGGTVIGGDRHGEDGYFLEPTIIKQTNNDMKVVKEEIFGPVLVVQTFENADEAMRLANDSQYGLAAAIWTENLGQAHQMAKQVKSGIVGLNCAMGADWDVPLGGYKQSGIGRENGRDGLELYLQTKSVFAAI
ncbi:MAG: aldehyde dehydrogenase family protein [Parasphingorhabdus sp.]|uniref:aldehyde dehydrogenase family protein n=1 Tax=Parasphingorhabdus sp. TaxID=2709688 RepID=UPI003298F829